MSRRNASIFDAMLDVASLLPWQAGLIIAVAAYFGFHHMALTPPQALAANGPQDLANNVGKQLLMGLSTILQFVVPFIFALGAGISFFRRRRQRALHSQVANHPSQTALGGISWQDFEVLTAEVFRRKGYRVVQRGGNGPDGGVDLELWSGRDKYLVQCKQWKVTRVGVATVRELYGVMAAEGAVGGFVVTAGEFTADAKKFAEGQSIELVSANLMLRLIAQTNADSASYSDEVPNCPRCGSEMVKRSATRGSMAGSIFWGCPRYPACTGTRPTE